MKLAIDRNRCCGNLECVRIAPALFAAGEDGLSEVLQQTPAKEFEALAREAVDACPAAAIVLKMEQG